MFRNRSARSAFWRQQGAGLPMAIFLITVMALIVTTIAQLQQSSGEMEALDILSTRAFYAAESGAQAGLVDALNEDGSSCGDVEDRTLTFGEAGLKGCTTEIRCDSSGSAVVIRSEGSCGSGTSEVVRTVEVKAR